MLVSFLDIASILLVTKSRTSLTSVTKILLVYYFENHPEFSLSGASSPSIARPPKIKKLKIISQEMIFII